MGLRETITTLSLLQITHDKKNLKLIKVKKVKVKSHSPVFAIPWTVACPIPLFMEFSRQRSTGVACHFLLQGIFPIPYPGIKPRSPALQEDSLPTEPPGLPFF